MIDELVRDGLESQVGPPPGREVWPRVDRASSLTRQRRRRDRVASVAAVSVVALLAIAVAWGALRSDGSGTRITVTTAPAPVAGEPSIAAGTIRLPTLADWKRPTGYGLGQVGLTTARVADSGHALVVYWSGGGVCDEPQAYRTHASTTTVSIELLRLDQGAMSCPYAPPTTFLVTLPEPLGDQRVVDASTGATVHLLDDPHLLVPTILLPGWSAQTELLTDKDTWTRCYGPARCDYQGLVITTAQGSDVDYVLGAGLGNFDDLTMQPATFVPSLAHAAFSYGTSSDHRGQSLPSSAKVAIEVGGTEGVILTSWANYTLLWHVGSTWYAASTPRHGSVTGGPTATGVGIPELIRIARSMAPAS